METAKGIWEQILTSQVTINIDFSMSALGTGILGGAGPNSFLTGITSAAGEPATVANTYYPVALANKLTRTDLNGATSEITASFTNNFSWSTAAPFNYPAPGLSWYFGLDGNPGANQIDFLSVCLHEIAHGLGYSGSVRNNGGTLQYQFAPNKPAIYDRFVTNNAATPVLLTSLATPSATLTTYLQSNTLAFNGANAKSSNGNINPKIYAPTTWEQGSSIYHLDEATFPAGNVNSLMTPALGNKEAIHQVGPIVRDMLKDIGWSDIIAVGVTDRIAITYVSGSSSGSISHFNEGQYVGFNAAFYDEYPYGASQSNYTWKLDLIHATGKYTILSSSGQYTNATVGYVPFGGYTWSRYADGSIRAILKVSGTDNQGYYHEDSRVVALNYLPDQPVVGTSAYVNCSQKVSVNFYSAGATSHTIYYGKTSGVPYTYSVAVPANQTDYTFSGLSNGNWYFNVVGSNATGASSYGNEKVVNVSCAVCCQSAKTDETATNTITNDLPLQYSINSWVNSNKVIIGFEPNAETNETVVLYNLMGQVVSSKQIQVAETKTELEAENISTGIYILKVFATNGAILHSQKIVITK
jgi:hypothetical protein